MEEMQSSMFSQSRLRGRPGSLLFFALLVGLGLIAATLYPTSANATTPITTCGDCHGYWGTLGSPASYLLVDNPAGTGRTPGNGRFEGSHNTHTGPWYTTTDSRYNMRCETCHVSPIWSSFSHQKGSIQINLRWFSLAGGVIQDGSVTGWGTYSKWSSFPVSNTPTFGTCSNTYCHSKGTGGTLNAGDPRPIAANTSALWGTNTPSTPVCTPCHGIETGNPGTGAPWYTSAYLTGDWTTAKANSHRVHAWQTSGSPGGPVCNKCHYATTATGNTITSIGNHIKRSYTVTPGTPLTPSINFTYTYQTGGGTCSAATCHGGNPAIAQKWGTIDQFATCVYCHGIAGKTTPQWTTDINVAAPGYSSIGRNAWGTIGAIVNNVSNQPKVGAHDSHLRMLKGYSTIRGVECSDCHAQYADPWDANHMNGQTNFVWSTLVKNQGNNNPKWTTLQLSPWYSSGNGGCGNIYCHGMSAPVGVAGNGWGSLRYNNQQWLTVSAAKDIVACNQCHLSPPTRTSIFDHTSYTIASDCAGCHNHNGQGADHINGILYGSGDCNACHWYNTTDAGAWSTVKGGGGGLWNSTNAWGAHVKHIDHIKARYGGVLNNWNTFGSPEVNLVCGVCHTQTVGEHKNTTRQVNFAFSTIHMFGTTAPSWDTISRGCSNLDCHYKPKTGW